MIIKIKNLRAKTIIGVYEWEKQTERELVLNIELEIDGSKACQTDKVADTLDYDVLSKMLIAEIAASSFELLERLSAHLLDKIMANKIVHRAKIEIDKGGVVKDVDSVSVIDERTR